jgi:phosphonoacetate hydrolase
MDQRYVTINGRDYLLPGRPTVAITLDGTGPGYLDAAMEAGAMPRLKGMLEAGGTYALGRAHMPTFTNPNNASIVTGVPPAVHGIPGNHYLSPDGTEVQLDDASFLRAETVHAAVRKAGVEVLAVTAKEKLRRLLGAGGVPSVSAEAADGHALPEYGIRDVPALVGEPPPGIYDPGISAYALKIGLAVHRRVGLGLLYVSLTDYVQHRNGPGSELAGAFYGGLDALVGEYLDEGFVVGLTADHGMNAKENPDGTLRVHYLSDVLEEAGVRGCRVVLPITDPYVRHHGALGSFAWVHAPGPSELGAARAVLSALEGVEEVFTREEASVVYRHPPDRIGDLSVASDAATALGGSRSGHDLSLLEDGLRSHGGRHEQVVPIIVSHPLGERYEALLRAGARNSDLHDLLLNGVVVERDGSVTACRSDGSASDGNT